MQLKKNKKKAKIDVKPAQPGITNDLKEPDEGKTGPQQGQI